MKSMIRKIKVAAVQMKSKNFDIEANLGHATEHIEKAASEGAQLVLLPELMPTGHIIMTEEPISAESGVVLCLVYHLISIPSLQATRRLLIQMAW